MNKQRAGPARCVMTVLAQTTGTYMTGRLAGGLPAIVTADATAGNGIVIHAYQRYPLRTGVTFLAQGHGLDVVSRHVLSGHPAATGMTNTTLCRRALEHATQMAAGTVSILVRTFKRKPGRQVIKADRIAFRGSLRTDKHGDGANQHQGHACLQDNTRQPCGHALFPCLAVHGFIPFIIRLSASLPSQMTPCRDNVHSDDRTVRRGYHPGGGIRRSLLSG